MIYVSEYIISLNTLQTIPIEEAFWCYLRDNMHRPERPFLGSKLLEP